MKKIIITLLGLLMITSASAASQTTFMPVLSEGKSWEVATISWDYENFPNSNDTTGYYTVYVCGDTIVNNLTCKKIEIVPKCNQNSSKTAVAYEKDGKVWNVKNDGEMVLIFDIGLHQNEEVDAGYVLKEDFISVNGFNRKRLLIDSGIDSYDYCYYVVEGIGISSDKWVSKLGIGNENEYTIMLSCSENGELVFTKEDFSKQDDYVPLVREGVVWEYVDYDSETGIQVGAASIYTLEFNGVSEEGHKLYRTDYEANGTAHEPYLVAYVNEENKVVTLNVEASPQYYFSQYTDSGFDKFYDFKNDELYFLPDEAIYFSYQLNDVEEVSSVAFTVEVGNTTRNGFHVNYDATHDIESKEFKVIEGIGVDCKYGDLLVPFRNFPIGKSPHAPNLYYYGWQMAGLSAVYEDGELVYQGCLYDEAQRLKTVTAINAINGDKQVANVRYYNLAGIESAEPFDGVSIRVTTYNDGTRTNEKILK